MNLRKYVEQIKVVHWKFLHWVSVTVWLDMQGILDFNAVGSDPSGLQVGGKDDLAFPLMLCLFGLQWPCHPSHNCVYFQLVQRCSHQKNWEKIIQNMMLVFSVMIFLF